MFSQRDEVDKDIGYHQEISAECGLPRLGVSGKDHSITWTESTIWRTSAASWGN